jgi:hypothetical protein
MAPKKSIQRERKAKSSPLEANTNIGDGAQQQVVKVVIQQPDHLNLGKERPSRKSIQRNRQP